MSRLPSTVSNLAMHWPETKALLDRLGIEISPHWRGLTIRMYYDSEVLVTQEHIGLDTQKQT